MLVISINCAFVWHLAIQFLHDVPVIGPMTIWPLRSFWGFFFGRPWAWPFNRIKLWIPQQMPLWSPFMKYCTNSVHFLFGKTRQMPIIALELETRLPVDNLTSGLRSTIDDATRLSQLGVSLLPVALIIQYSSQSIMAARSIVQGSRVYQKADLLNGYSTLLDSTNELYDLLDDFDNEFESLYIFGNTI